MTSELIASAQSLLGYMLVLSLQLLAILLLRKPVARSFGAVTAYRLWALPLLWLPFHWIELPAFDWYAVLSAGSEQVSSLVSWAPQAMMEFDLDLPTLALHAPTSVWAYWLWLTVITVWLVTALLLLALQVLRIRQFSVGLSTLTTEHPRDAEETSLPAGVKICYLQGLGSPALFGVIRPRLLLPADFERRFSRAQRQLIIQHESVHLKRLDNLWNLVATLFRLLFWFNPVLHVAWKRFRLDQELSCDERVLQEVCPDIGKQYARTLLATMGDDLSFRHQPTLTTWGNLREIRERAKMIQHHIDHKPRHSAGKWLLLGCILGGSLTTALYNSDVSRAVAAEPEAPANVLTLSREVYERIESIVEFRNERDYEAAKERLDELHDMHRQETLNNYESYMMFLFYGSIALDQRDYETAIEYYREILDIPELSPEQEAMSRSTLGQLLFQTEDYQGATDQFMRALELADEPMAGIYPRIAAANQAMERFEEALIWADQALEIDEDMRTESYRLLHSIFQANGRDETAQRIEQIIAERGDQSEG